MLEQLTLFEVKQQKKRVHYDTPVYNKQDKINKNIQKWNTIKHIYRYQTLYKIYEKLFFLTYNNQLECLNYYSETENDGNNTYTIMYAEMDNTSALSIKERVLEHIDLLRRIKNNDNTLERDVKKIDSDTITFFG